MAALVKSTEPKALTDVAPHLVSEHWSLDTVTITGGAYEMGTVLGKVTAGTVPTTGTAAGGNTGNGTCATVTGGVDVQPGDYTIRCKVAVANGGVFEVLNPKGACLGLARVGTAFVSPEINLTLNDGATDYAVEDAFTVTVPGGDGVYTLHDPAAIDGTAHAVAVLATDCDASAADKKAPVIARGAVLDAAGLAWKSGMTTNQKNAAIAQLKALGMIVRDML